LYIADSPGGKSLEAMREKIDDPRNRELYGRRMQIIEPCFADIECCKKMNRFTLRGKKKVRGQWLLFCIVHNIGKCVPNSPGIRRSAWRMGHAGQRGQPQSGFLGAIHWMIVSVFEKQCSDYGLGRFEIGFSDSLVVRGPE
jgi:hypothetical protein